MTENDRLLLDIAQDVSFIKGVITDYPEMVRKTNDNEIRSTENETAILDLKSSQKWLFRLVGTIVITWILTQVFFIVGR